MLEAENKKTKTTMEHNQTSLDIFATFERLSVIA